MICGRAILLLDCRAHLDQQKDPVVQISASCQQEFGESFWRQAANLDLSRHLMDKAPCSVCGGFCLRSVFQAQNNQRELIISQPSRKRRWKLINIHEGFEENVITGVHQKNDPVLNTILGMRIG